VPPPDIEWVPGIRWIRLTVLAFNWTALVVTVGFLAALVLTNLGWIHEPVLLGVASTVGLFAVLIFVLILLSFSRIRPGFFDIGVSPIGLSVRYPLRTRTFPWSELVWYNDRMRVEGISGWRGPSLMALTPVQYQRIQRWFQTR
jgi:hypothetical protein